MIKVRRIGHATFESPDLGRAIDYYTQTNGLVLAAKDNGRAFLATRTGLLAIQLERGSQPRCTRLSFEVAPDANFAEFPVVWGPLRFGPGHNIAIFHRDHDGHTVELYTDLDQMKDEALGYFDPRPWHRDRPQRPKTWKRQDGPIWGMPPPPDFLRT